MLERHGFLLIDVVVLNTSESIGLPTDRVELHRILLHDRNVHGNFLEDVDDERCGSEAWLLPRLTIGGIGRLPLKDNNPAPIQTFLADDDRSHRTGGRIRRTQISNPQMLTRLRKLGSQTEGLSSSRQRTLDHFLDLEMVHKARIIERGNAWKGPGDRTPSREIVVGESVPKIVSHVSQRRVSGHRSVVRNIMSCNAEIGLVVHLHIALQAIGLFRKPVSGANLLMTHCCVEGKTVPNVEEDGGISGFDRVIVLSIGSLVDASKTIDGKATGRDDFESQRRTRPRKATLLRSRASFKHGLLRSPSGETGTAGCATANMCSTDFPSGKPIADISILALGGHDMETKE